MTAQAMDVTCAQVAAHYDDLDSLYREFWGEHVHHGLWEHSSDSPERATRHLIEAVAWRARIEPEQAVCDVGCGYGGTARVLAREHGANVTALTISPAQHAYALTVDAATGNPTYLLCDWLENRLDSNAFDAVIAIESTEHMTDLATFFREAARVLRPGGRLVVCAWLTREAPRAWELRTLIEPICREGRMRGMESIAAMRHLAADAGLVAQSADDVSPQVRRTWTICIQRVLGGLLRSPAHRRFLLRDGGPNRIFGLTMLRIWLAYRIGAMRYGILTYVKP